ncbi:cysteine desulfurase [Streptococcus parauberis]|nr:cysteine desulfurase [Streptococcus parauberis]
MAFEKEIALKDCKYTYIISPKVKKYTLRDTTFSETKIGHYELTRLLEEVPNSGEGFPLKITINKDLSSFKLTITDKSTLRLVNIFKSEDNKIIQDKFYFLMDSLVERDIFIKQEN